MEQQDKDPFVLELGSYQHRFGIAGDDAPKKQIKHYELNSVESQNHMK